MPGLVYAVIGNAVLQEIIGADFFRSVCRANLGFAVAGILLGLLLFLEPLKLGYQYLHSLLLVGSLISLRLLAYINAGRFMNNSDRSLYLVDILAAGTSGARSLDFYVGRLDFYSCFLAYRKNGHRCR